MTHPTCCALYHTINHKCSILTAALSRIFSPTLKKCRYESSGYDDTFFGRQQRGYSNASPFRPSQVAASSALFSSPDVSASEAPQHTIESGPSFNESLERFRSATDGETSDGEGLRPAATPSSYKQSVFKQSSHQQQKYSQQTHSSSFSSSQHRTTKSVEEQRTISSKTYRIE